jgi:hypothetical protein
MANQTKLTVTTDIGTFTRKTVRTYSHIVVIKGERKEVLEARRLAAIASDRKQAARYDAILATGRDPRDVTDWSRQHTAQVIADGSLAKWAQEARARADALDASGPITADQGDTFSVLGWTGRLDLALKLAGTEQALNYRHIRIYAIDGTQVR